MSSGKRQIPRVLFTSPECRAVVIQLERRGDGRPLCSRAAVVQVVNVRVPIETSSETVECDADTPITVNPC